MIHDKPYLKQCDFEPDYEPLDCCIGIKNAVVLCGFVFLVILTIVKLKGIL